LLTVLTIFVFVLLTLATVSGRWAFDRNQENIWHETGIWSTCTCQSMLTGQCMLNDTYLRVVEGFSIIAALCEWFVVFILAHEFLVRRGSKHHFTSVLVLCGLAVAANIITWATFASYFRKDDICQSGEQSWKQAGFHLSWGFGVRLIELGMLLVLLVLVALVSSRGEERSALHFFAYFVACVLLMSTLLTTSGRGWLWKTNTGVTNSNDEVGLWDECQCQEMFHDSCNDKRQRIRTVEVFSVVSIVGTGLLLLALAKGTQSVVAQRVISALAIIASIIVVTTFSEYVKNSYCDTDPIFNTQALHWAYGAACAGLIFQALVFFGLFTVHPEPEAKEEPKELTPTEPTA